MKTNPLDEAARKAALDACAHYGHKGLAAFGNGRFDLAYRAAYDAIEAWRKDALQQGSGQ